MFDSAPIARTLVHAWRFAVVAVRAFKHNKGLLLASGVGYNMLLSLVPMLVVLLLGLSNVWPRQQIVTVLDRELQRVVPGHASTVTAAVTAFIDNSEVIGVVVVVVLLFFASLAFRMIEGALDVIFREVPIQTRRKRWVSAVIPYVYIIVLGLILLALTAVSSTISTLADRPLVIHTHIIELSSVASLLLQSAGFVILALVFTSMYLVLPVQTIGIRRAFVGGVVVAALWESVRHLLVWYFEQISLVNVVYGSLATVIVVLLTMEIAAIIMLFGAQVIATLEKNAASGLPWWGGDAASSD